MMDLKDYQERKDLLGGWYDRVIEADELLQADVDSLRESKSNLYEDRFVVAVCGEMNIGKSTLLNALLFEEEVLPNRSTTMTAKITLMEGNATERIEATLYTPDEFQRVKDACSSNPQAYNELITARETARYKKLKESDLLTEPARVLSEDGLHGLVQFAAVCSEGGIYSVYVKSVRLWADRSWLHQVTVADTPGTDDPNPERDKITREWIQQADAVVYVTFAGQAGMTDQDVKFIDEHLAHIDPSRRIIAVNKCDRASNTEAVRNHIRKIQNSEDLRMKNLFGADDQIVLVSGLGALISAMQHAGRPLSEDMKWHIGGELSAKGYLEPELHGLEKLRTLVEQRIIATKGDGIIQAHQRRLDSVFEYAAKRLSQDRTVLENNINAVNASRTDRDKERKQVLESITSLSSHINDARIKFNKELDDLYIILDERINEVSDKIYQKIANTIGNERRIDTLAVKGQWSLPHELHKERGTLAKAIRTLVNQIETMLNNTENQLSDTLLASGLGVRISQTHLLPVSARTICKDAEDKLENLNLDALNKVINESTTWWQRILNTSGGLRDAVARLEIELRKILKEALHNIPEHTKRELDKLSQEAFEAMEGSCRDILERRRELLDELEKGDLSDEKKEAQLGKELGEVEKRMLQVETLQEEYQTAVGI